MSDDTTTTPETPAAPTPSQEPAKTFSEDYVKQLRDEAARYRNEKKTAVEQANAAKDTEYAAVIQAHEGKVTALETDLGDAWVELAKIHAALEAQIPSQHVLQFASLLKGSDPESIKASAESAKALFGGIATTHPATDPTQGSGGNPLPLNGDPLLQAIKKAVGA